MTRESHINGQKKQATFKRAFETIESYCERKNYIAAYVVVFSVIEDRLRALYVKWFRIEKGCEPTLKQINDLFSRLVSILARNGTIASDLAAELLKEARNRNELLHSAMWNLDKFNGEVVASAMALARLTDKASRKRQMVKNL